jgi:hypothetical protein
MKCVIGCSKPKYLCRWWMKTRQINKLPATIIEDNKVYLSPCYEFYCPIWAKPLDFIWKLIFGKPKLGKI